MGTEKSETRVQKGRLVIPYTNAILPKLTFEPEGPNTGSWVYEGKITSSKVNDTSTKIEEQPDSQSVDWTSPSGEYSYQVNVTYSNKVELDARHVIVTQTQAKQLASIEQVNELINAKGRPFFKTSLTNEQLADIQATTFSENELSKKYAITYEAGTSGENTLSQIKNLVVVPDSSVISTDQQVALYTQDIQIPRLQANALKNQSDLDQLTKATVIFAETKSDTTAQLDPTTFSAIQQTTAEQLPNTVNAVYSYQINDTIIKKETQVYIYGGLELLETPANIDFGTQKVTTKTMTYWANLSDNLVVRDTRGKQRSPWQLMVTQTQPLTNKSNDHDQLESVLFYQDQTSILEINQGAIPIFEIENPEDKTYEINTNWSSQNKKGLQLTVPVEKQKKDSYEGTLVWSLVDAPGND